MKKIKSKLAKAAVIGGAGVLSVMGLVGCGEQQPAETAAATFTVTDMLGREVTIPADADSFVCVGAGALRYYTYVADKNELAGVENVEKTWLTDGRPYTMALGDISNMPVIGQGGPDSTANAEAILQVAPDVIFSMYNTDPAAVEDLQAKTNIPVVVLSYGTDTIFEDATYNSLSLVGKVTGNEDRANEVINYLKTTETDLKSRVASVTEQPEAYLGAINYKGTKGITSTSGNYMPFDVLNILNVSKEHGITGAQADTDKETLLEMDPENIFIDAQGLATVKTEYQDDPEYFESLQAVASDNVYLQLPFKNYFTNLEIAIGDAYYIGSVLYPEQFADIDPEKKFDEISNSMLGISCYEKLSTTYGKLDKVDIRN